MPYLYRWGRNETGSRWICPLSFCWSTPRPTRWKQIRHVWWCSQHYHPPITTLSTEASVARASPSENSPWTRPANGTNRFDSVGICSDPATKYADSGASPMSMPYSSFWVWFWHALDRKTRNYNDCWVSISGSGSGTSCLPNAKLGWLGKLGMLLYSFFRIFHIILVVIIQNLAHSSSVEEGSSSSWHVKSESTHEHVRVDR